MKQFVIVVCAFALGATLASALTVRTLHRQVQALEMKIQALEPELKSRQTKTEAVVWRMQASVLDSNTLINDRMVEVSEHLDNLLYLLESSR